MGGPCTAAATLLPRSSCMLLRPAAATLLPRSLKYMLGVARGAWVVSYAWLDACAAAGAWVSEKAFEAKVGGAGVRGCRRVHGLPLLQEYSAGAGSCVELILSLQASAAGWHEGRMS